ncbi:hypothetical protein P8452_73601 [Trifolium repens]|nr:hypothetical protein P8452_73601 [Trifolium repens]
MNSSARKFYTVFMYLCLVIFLLISTCEPLGIFESGGCREISKTWEKKYCHYNIPNNYECNSTCVNLEHALSGACQYSPRSWSFPRLCYCNYKCNEYIPRWF